MSLYVCDVKSEYTSKKPCHVLDLSKLTPCCIKHTARSIGGRGGFSAIYVYSFNVFYLGLQSNGLTRKLHIARKILRMLKEWVRNLPVEIIYKTSWETLKIIRYPSERVTFREKEKKEKKIEKVWSPGSSPNFASNIKRI